MMKIKIKLISLLLCSAFIHLSFAATQCTSGKTLQNEPLYFFSAYLGQYTIHFDSTLVAIKQGNVSAGFPYYQKKWRSRCPGGLQGGRGSCHEFTVYPNETNFQPNLMTALKNETGGSSNRGSVRILTDASFKQYVYTTDHYNSFCGPYGL